VVLNANGEQVSVELILFPEIRTEQQETRQKHTENDFSKIPTELVTEVILFAIFKIQLIIYWSKLPFASNRPIYDLTFANRSK